MEEKEQERERGSEWERTGEMCSHSCNTLFLSTRNRTELKKWNLPLPRFFRRHHTPITLYMSYMVPLYSPGRIRPSLLKCATGPA